VPDEIQAVSQVLAGRTQEVPKRASIRLLADLICACAATAPGFAADQGDRAPVPNFSSVDIPWIPTSGAFLPLPAGLGPVTYDKANPVMVRTLNNRGVAVEGPLPLADLNNPNLKPWVVDHMRTQLHLIDRFKLRDQARLGRT
jgi:hypothetical protein